MSIFDIVAYVGGTVLGLQMIPQIWKVHRSESASDLSYLFLVLNLFGLLCMATYGIHRKEQPLYVPIVFSIVTTVILIALKFKCERGEQVGVVEGEEDDAPENKV